MRLSGTLRDPAVMSALYRMAAWVVIDVRADVSLPSGLS
jgi:hypothetical protein